jgi:glycosyltransferase involved in cell wall biosynthesis
MRIGFDAKRYLYNNSGLGNYSRALISGLRHYHPEHEYLLFTNKVPENYAERDLEVVHNPAGGKGYRSFGVTKDILRMRCDLFHGLSNEMPYALNKYLPTVVTIHDVIYRRYPGFYPWVDRQVYHFKTGYAVKHADIIIATSQATADDLQLFYKAHPGKIRVVYQPVDPAFYSRDNHEHSPSEPYFFYHSGFSARKNHASLIEAFALIRKQCSWNLVLAGRSGETLEICRRMIESEKLGDRVRILENISQEHLVEAMKNAAAFVYPSLIEGFGIPLAEAAACRLNMAVSNIPVFRELAGDSVNYFHPNKPAEIAGAMMDLYFAEKAQDHSGILDKINPEKTALALVDIYKSLVHP